jgi:large subunit ribosomal protein L7/L12
MSRLVGRATGKCVACLQTRSPSASAIRKEFSSFRNHCQTTGQTHLPIYSPSVNNFGGHIRCFSDEKTAEKEEDPRHSDDFIDIENTKVWEQNTDIKTTQRVESVFKEILKLDVVQVFLMTQLVQEKLGIDAAMAAAMTAGGGGSSGGGAAVAAAPVEAKTKFDVKLTGFDAKVKIKVIKEVRTICGLGLKEAKDLVEGVPKILMKDLKKEDAEALKAKLEALGATVDIE